MTFDSNSDIIKWVCSSCACLLAFIGCVVPSLIRSQNWILRIDSFSGGILFATGFVHLLEDATDYIFKYGKTPYPVSGTTAVATFSALTIILVFLSSDKKPSEIRDNQTESLKKSKNRQSLTKSKKRKNADADDADKELSAIDGSDSDLESNLINSQPSQSNEIDSKMSSLERKKSKNLFGQNITCLPIMTILFYLIFSMNAVLEGIKMGIINSKKEFISFSLLVFVRKIFEAYLLGLTLLDTKPKKSLYFSIVVIYSILFLVGTLLSILLKLKENLLIFGILFSISAGTFVYAGVSKWAVMFLNRRKWSYVDKFWHLGLFSIAILVIILVAISAK